MRTLRLLLVVVVLGLLAYAALSRRKEAGWTVTDVELDEARCESKKDASGCARAGWAYLRGDGAKEDEVRARKLFERGCELGSGWCCGMQARGIKLEPNTDVGRVVELERLLDRACELGDAPSCEWHAQRIGWMAADGRAHPHRARELLRAGCHREPEYGCGVLGENLLTDPHSSPLERRAGVRFLQQSCDAGISSSCGMALEAQLCGLVPDASAEDAFVALLDRCEEDDLRACTAVARASKVGIGTVELHHESSQVEVIKVNALEAIFENERALYRSTTKALGPVSSAAAKLHEAADAIDTGDWGRAEQALQGWEAADGGASAEEAMLRAALAARRDGGSVTRAMASEWRRLGMPALNESPLLANTVPYEAFTCWFPDRPADAAFKNIRAHTVAGTLGRASDPLDPRLRTLLLGVTAKSPMVDRLLAVMALRSKPTDTLMDPELRTRLVELAESLHGDNPQDGFFALLALNGLPLFDPPGFSDEVIAELELIADRPISAPRGQVVLELHRAHLELPAAVRVSTELLSGEVYMATALDKAAPQLRQRLAVSAYNESSEKKLRIARLLLKFAHQFAKSPALIDLYEARELADAAWRIGGLTEAKEQSDRWGALSESLYRFDDGVSKLGRWPLRCFQKEWDVEETKDEIGFYAELVGVDAGR